VQPGQKKHLLARQKEQLGAVKRSFDVSAWQFARLGREGGLAALRGRTGACFESTLSSPLHPDKFFPLKAHAWSRGFFATKVGSTASALLAPADSNAFTVGGGRH
jgi:hypothetical protein